MYTTVHHVKLSHGSLASIWLVWVVLLGWSYRDNVLHPVLSGGSWLPGYRLGLWRLDPKCLAVLH